MAPKVNGAVEIAKLQVEVKGLREIIEIYKESTHTAVDLAAKELTARLEGMNNFRTQLEQQATTFLTRKEFYWAMSTFTGIIIAVFTALQWLSLIK